jgi:hypothetical protein
MMEERRIADENNDAVDVVNGGPKGDYLHGDV